MHTEHTDQSDHFNIHFDTDNMDQPPPPPQRTMSELTEPEFTYDSLCIPEEEVLYVLKTRLINLLPKFHGLASEDPCKNLKQCHVLCSTMKPADVQEDNLYLKAFPHLKKDRLGFGGEICLE